MPTENSNLSISGPGAKTLAPENESRAGQEAPAIADEYAEMPKEELERLAEDLGLDLTRYPTRQLLSLAVRERRALIANMDREAMLELVRWGRREVPVTAGSEQLAREIVTIRSMRFGELSRGALAALAELRGAQVELLDDEHALILKLKRQEGVVEKFQRKKRAFLGKLVANIVGENDSAVIRGAPVKNAPARAASSQREASIKEDIEESGLLSGISNRIKRTADQYLNQKLDEIEARIDRKLQEIDQHLSEWRDREIANRLRIIKITLWASVIVGIVSLIYSWVKIYVTSMGR
jgi:hypothetical protein